MPVVQKTYAELGELWGVSKEAARKKVEALHLPRKPGNDGRVRVTIDLTEVSHTPKPIRPETARRPAGDQAESDAGDQQETTPETIALKGQISTLEARVLDLQTALDRERSERDRERQELSVDRDRERSERMTERERAEKITAELAELAKRFTNVTDEGRAREAALQSRVDEVRARLETAQARMAELRARPWWRRLTAA